jgi:hypothetical protein
MHPGVVKVAQANANEAELLLQAHADTFPEGEGNIRQLLARTWWSNWPGRVPPRTQQHTLAEESDQSIGGYQKRHLPLSWKSLVRNNETGQIEGKYLSECEALKAGYRAAYYRPCGSDCK